MEFRDKELDILREVINIGAGNASNALSSLMGNKIMMEVPEVSKVSIKGIELNFPSDNPSIIIHTQLTNSITSSMVFVMSLEEGIKLTSRLTSQDISVEDFKDKLISVEENITKSSIVEVINIISGSFANAVSAVMNNNVIKTSVPSITFDYLPGAIDSIIAEASLKKDEIFIFKTRLVSEEQVTSIDFILIFYDGAEEKILSSLQVEH